MNNTISINHNQLFEMALEVMPVEFSSLQFVSKLREFGYTQRQVLNERHLKWLITKCSRIGRRMWVKNQVKDSEPFQKQNVIVFDNPQLQTFTIENCAAFLKKNGCKVLIPVTDYKEF